jgi:hypothetical protein
MTEHHQPPVNGHAERREGRLFPLGQLFATPGAIDACERAKTTPLAYITRHAAGDWGDMDPEDIAANDRALEHGGRLFSAYNLPTDERLWVITEADYSATTALTPMEY